jgi:Lrp/AsnC family transcriptional regulator, leucine-responsive regulatory protein
MDLSARERKTLAAIEHRGNATIPMLRKLTHSRDHTLRYCLRTLTDRGVIVGKAPFINMYPLGFTEWTIFFSLACESEKLQRAFISALVRSPVISWVGALGGEYQFGIALMVRRVEQVSALLNGLAAKYGNIVFKKALSLKTSFTAFGRKYLCPEMSIPVLSFAGTGKETSIDEIDDRILSAMAGPPYHSNRQLAQSLGIPGTSVERRIDRLEAAKIIAGYIYRLRLAAFDIQAYRLLVFARGMNPELTRRLRDFAAQHPQVLHFIECLGPWDYELGVEVEHAEAVTGISNALSSQFGAAIYNIQLLQVFRHLKYSGYPGSHAAE